MLATSITMVLHSHYTDDRTQLRDSCSGGSADVSFDPSRKGATVSTRVAPYHATFRALKVRGAVV